MTESLAARARVLHERLVNLNVGHPIARDLSNRDRAHLAQYYERFGRGNFSLADIFKVDLSDAIIDRFSLVREGTLRQDDMTVLTKRLGPLGHLIHLNGSQGFRLSESGIAIAEETALN